MKSSSPASKNLLGALRAGVMIVAVSISPELPAQQAAEDAIELLRQEIARMRAEYESRISELESRLAAAEKDVALSPPATETAIPASPATISVGRSNKFNPAIGVTFQGQAWAFDNDPDGYYIPGFPLAGETGPAAEGFSLAETEIIMSANVDDKFTAMLTLPVAVEDGEVGVELEEAWVETMGLPAGLAIRMGRFFSAVGYLNDKHFHAWDFADQALVYQAFLGSQYIDDGVQMRWLAPTEFYLELTGEILRGGRYPAGGAANSGFGAAFGAAFGATTLSATTGGDIGFSHSWQLGLSWLGADSDARVSGTEEDPFVFSGKTDMYVADFVWKWAPNGNSRQRNFKFQAEYMWRREDGHYGLGNGAMAPWKLDQRGWYAIAVFQPFPRWRFGARIDRLGSDTPDFAFIDPGLFAAGAGPKRYSVMVDWSNSEFSRLRFQYNRDLAGIEDDNQFGLQYIFSIGAHGAHSF